VVQVSGPLLNPRFFNHDSPHELSAFTQKKDLIGVVRGSDKRRKITLDPQMVRSLRTMDDSFSPERWKV
jgi:hypothetical protein